MWQYVLYSSVRPFIHSSILTDLLGSGNRLCVPPGLFAGGVVPVDRYLISVCLLCLLLYVFVRSFIHINLLGLGNRIIFGLFGGDEVRLNIAVFRA